MNSGLDMVGYGWALLGKLDLMIQRSFPIQMILCFHGSPLQLEAPEGHWIPLRLEGLLLCSRVGRACWELLVGGTGHGCPIPGRNEPALDRHREKQEGSEASSSSPWSCFRRGWSHGSSCLVQTMPAPVQIFLSGIVGAGFWDDHRGMGGNGSGSWDLS